MSDTERLVRLRMKDGRHVDFFRDEDNTVRIKSDTQEVKLPHASGEQTTQLFSLLEPYGEIEEEINE